MQKTLVRSLGQEDHLEKEMAIYSSILAWKIPWTEEPGGLQSLGWQRVGHDWVTKTVTKYMHESSPFWPPNSISVRFPFINFHATSFTLIANHGLAKFSKLSVESSQLLGLCICISSPWSLLIFPNSCHPGIVPPKKSKVLRLCLDLPKKVSVKECSNYCTIAPISHASKVMLKILQARLQQYVNCELPDAQSGFRKGRGTRDQIANIRWIIEKAREIQKKHLFLLYWLCQSLQLYESQQTVENSERDGNTRPPDLPLEKPVYMTGRNG